MGVCRRKNRSCCQLVGYFSILFNYFANFRRSFRTGLPASKVGVVVDGGLVKIEVMSCAACLQKFRFYFREGCIGRKNVTVPYSLTILDLGKYV